jgi:hypothetical protein
MRAREAVREREEVERAECWAGVVVHAGRREGRGLRGGNGLGKRESPRGRGGERKLGRAGLEEGVWAGFFYSFSFFFPLLNLFKPLFEFK